MARDFFYCPSCSTANKGNPKSHSRILYDVACVDSGHRVLFWISMSGHKLRAFLKPNSQNVEYKGMIAAIVPAVPVAIDNANGPVFSIPAAIDKRNNIAVIVQIMHILCRFSS